MDRARLGHGKPKVAAEAEKPFEEFNYSVKSERFLDSANWKVLKASKGVFRGWNMLQPCQPSSLKDLLHLVEAQVPSFGARLDAQGVQGPHRRQTKGVCINAHRATVTANQTFDLYIDPAILTT